MNGSRRFVPYQELDRGYVTARPIGQQGLTGELHAACLPALWARP